MTFQFFLMVSLHVEKLFFLNNIFSVYCSSATNEFSQFLFMLKCVNLTFILEEFFVENNPILGVIFVFIHKISLF